MSARRFWSVRDQFMVVFVVVALLPLAAYALITYSLTKASLVRLERDEIRNTASGVQAALMDKANNALQLTQSRGSPPDALSLHGKPRPDVGAQERHRRRAELHE